MIKRGERRTSKARMSVILLTLSTFLMSIAISSVTYHKFLRPFIPSCCSTAENRLKPPTAPNSITSIKISGSKESARRFSWKEIESFTKSFTSDVIGEGGFSKVYLAHLPDSSLAAVKLYRSGNSDRLLRAFKQELDILLRLSHPHIVGFIGYSDSGEDNVLVFEFVPGGTLRDKLHKRGSVGSEVLSWSRRLSIALHVAEALEYLHEGCKPQIIHGDITSSNVLIDDRGGPKLCDFGSAVVGFSATVKRAGGQIMVGSPGYTDPHYLRTGIVSKKSDVYSFGVLLLELVTDRPAFAREVGILPPTGVVETDPVMGGQAAEALNLAANCVGDKPSLRPSMAEIIRTIREMLMPSPLSAVPSKSDGFADIL